VTLYRSNPFIIAVNPPCLDSKGCYKAKVQHTQKVKNSKGEAGLYILPRTRLFSASVTRSSHDAFLIGFFCAVQSRNPKDPW
jgi:hypothetical protein